MYSFVKPRKGSNVDVSQDMMDALIQPKDIRLLKKRTAQEKWKVIADKIIENCEDLDSFDIEMEYTNDTIHENMVHFMAGYVSLIFTDQTVCVQVLRY